MSEHVGAFIIRRNPQMLRFEGVSCKRGYVSFYPRGACRYCVKNKPEIESELAGSAKKQMGGVLYETEQSTP